MGKEVVVLENEANFCVSEFGERQFVQVKGVNSVDLN